MLTDTGPLVALVDRNQSAHSACMKVYDSAALPLVTTWPCLSESMHILGRLGGWRAQATLWGLLENAGLSLHITRPPEIERMRSLMEKYKDLPMDLGDASLVAAAETRRIRRIFTLDGDFRIYRTNVLESFQVVP